MSKTLTERRLAEGGTESKGKAEVFLQYRAQKMLTTIPHDSFYKLCLGSGPGARPNGPVAPNGDDSTSRPPDCAFLPPTFIFGTPAPRH